MDNPKLNATETDARHCLRRLVLRFRHAADCRYDVASKSREKGKYDGASEASADAYMRCSTEVQRVIEGDEVPPPGEAWADPQNGAVSRDLWPALLRVSQLASDAVEAGAIDECYLSLLRDAIAALPNTELTGPKGPV